MTQARVACKAAQNEIWKFRVNTSSDQKWFCARDKLRAYLTKDQIRKTLDCICFDCEQDRLSCSTGAIHYIDAILKAEDRGAVGIFGLLVHLRRPQLIANFVSDNWNDQTFVDTLTRAHDSSVQNGLSIDTLENFYWPELKKRSPEESNRLAVDFTNDMYAFAVPTIDSDQFYKFGPKTRLPFINEMKLDHKGSSATVYSFNIEASYRSPKFATKFQKFARKEITDPDTRRSYQERDNLSIVKELRDPHIVEMLKAYKHGEAFNIIFPFYPTDLDSRLRDDNSVADASHTLQDRAEWRQFLGIANAILKMGQPKTAASDARTPTHLQLPGKPMTLGFHFDLKPANILIDDDGRWVVTDFGQAYFATPKGSTTKVRGQGGTDTYAPPEYDDINAALSRLYDVWSLGCILLEVIVHAIGGTDAVKRLDKERTMESQEGTETRYWQYERSRETGKIQRPILKHAVKGFVDDEINACQPSSSRTFMKKLWSVALEMLQPEVQKRKPISHIVDCLKGIVDELDAVQGINTLTITPSSRIQNKLLKNGRYYYYSDDAPNGEINYTETVSMNTSWDDQCDFKIHLSGTRSKDIDISRQSYMFVPLYGYARQKTNPLFGAHFYLSKRWATTPTVKKCYAFAVDTRQTTSGSWPDAFAAQAACTGQSVIFSSNKIAKFRYRSSQLRWLKFSRKSATSEDLDATTIAIWKYENSSNDPKDMGSSIPVYRLVLFSGNSLFCFKITKEWTIDEEASKDKQVVFEPTDSISASEFSGSLLKPPEHNNPSEAERHSTSSEGRKGGVQQHQTYAGIPLDPEHLIESERASAFDTNKLTLTFEEIQDARQFIDLFLMVKRIHRKERNANSSTRH